MKYSKVDKLLPGYERAYNLLCDDKSKEVLIGRLKCFMTQSPLIPLDICPLPVSPLGSQYFDGELISLSDDEIFVDGGMYTGDTAEQFIKMTKGKFKHYYGFEPEKDNYSTAVTNLREYSSVTTINKGLWSEDDRLRFSAGLTASSEIGDAGNSLVDVTSLDSFFADKEPPTFIKMDIEGAELEALKGTQRLIREHKLKLAICAYHKPEDIYTLPEFIQSCRDDYRFYLRHYTNSTN